MCRQAHSVIRLKIEKHIVQVLRRCILGLTMYWSSLIPGHLDLCASGLELRPILELRKRRIEILAVLQVKWASLYPLICTESV